MRIVDVLSADALGAYWHDDQAAIRAGAEQDGFAYAGSPRTPGFHAIRMPARALSIGLVLGDGHVAWGDLLTVQYAGAGGREPPFRPEAARELVARLIAPRVLNDALDGFRAACSRILAPDADGRPVPRSIAYGISQAVLAAIAHQRGCTPTEVLCDDYGLPLVTSAVPLFAQSGDDRRANVDKMILKRVDVLPHGLINNRDKLGPRGATFAAYADWVAKRVRELGGDDYTPVLHFDLYGTAGLEFAGDIEAIADWLATIESSLRPFRLRIETPFDFGSRDAQIDGFLRLRAALNRRGAALELVADEWCDTIDDVRAFAAAGAAHLVQVKMPDMGSLADSAQAVIECQAGPTRAYLGGSCAETDLSARAAVHVALATRPVMLLAKPGMGVDEALTIVSNEQQRTLATLRARTARRTAAT
jgi:methylaspartate ammonia-lyase